MSKWTNQKTSTPSTKQQGRSKELMDKMLFANLPADSNIADIANRLLSVANEYWTEYNKICKSNAVVWLQSSDGQLIIMTRGEYTDELLDCIKDF